MIANIQAYLYGALAVAVLSLAVYFGHHERVVGEQKVQAAQAAADARAQLQITQVQDHANDIIRELQSRLAQSLLTPPANPISVRVCPNAPIPFTPGPEVAAASSGSNGTGGRSAGMASSSEGGVDIGPVTEVILNRLTARLRYLQGYVKACQDAGICGPTP